MPAGALGVVGLAVAVGGLTVSSIIGGGGGGGASAVKAPQPVKQLLDRVPEPLPVGRKLQQTASQVSSKGEMGCSIPLTEASALRWQTHVPQVLLGAYLQPCINNNVCAVCKC